MVWLSPKKRTSTTGIKVFSSYETVSSEGLFVLQTLKVGAPQGERAHFRIILKTTKLADYPYYSIAHSDDLDSIKNEEWAYILNEIPRKLPIDWDRKKRKLWLTAHFQQLALEQPKQDKMGRRLNQPAQATLGPNSTDEGQDTCESTDEDRKDTFHRMKSSVGLRHREKPKHHKRSKSEICTLPHRNHIANSLRTKTTSSKITPTRNTVRRRNSRSDYASDFATWNTSTNEDITHHFNHPDHSNHPNTGPHTTTNNNSNTMVVISGITPYLMAFLGFNLFVLLLHDSDLVRFGIAIFVLNIFLYCVFMREEPVKIVLEVKKTNDTADIPRNLQCNFQSNEAPTPRTITPRPTKQRTKHPSVTSVATPTSNSAVSEDSLDDRTDDQTASPPSMRASMKKLIPLSERAAGESLPRFEPGMTPSHVWEPADSEVFSVRHGPNYKKNRTKAPSDKPSYRTVAADIFFSEYKIEHIADKIGSLPGPRFDPDVDEWPNQALARSPDDDVDLNYVNDAPYLFIINFMIPTYNPSLFSPEGDGEGYNIVFYMCLTKDGRAEMESRSTPASQLWRNFCLHHASGLHARLKCIPQIMNVPDLGLDRVWAPVVTNYNAKPFLTGPKYHTFHEGPGYLEVDVDIHRYCYMARRICYSLRDSLGSYVHKAVWEIGLVVEGKTDDELPEQLLCCVRVHQSTMTMMTEYNVMVDCPSK